MVCTFYKEFKKKTINVEMKLNHFFHKTSLNVLFLYHKLTFCLFLLNSVI